MALTNCKVVEDVTAEQTYGEGNISSYELFIEPEEGFYVAAKDFTDNTFETFGSAVQGVIDFGTNDKLELTDTTTAYAPGNKVKVTVNLYPDYSITEDTIVEIDIDGAASETEATPVYIYLYEEFSNHSSGELHLTPESGVSTSNAISTGAYSGNRRHEFTYSGQVGVETKVATMVFKALNTDPSLTTVNIVSNPVEGLGMAAFHENGEGFRLVYLDGGIGENDVTVSTEQGTKVSEKYVELWYTPQEGVSYSNAPISAMQTGLENFKSFYKVRNVNGGMRSFEITDVTTDLGSLPSGSSNVIPDSGITSSNPPIVRVFGTPGSTFKIEFRESRVVDGTDTSRSTVTGANGFFNGEIPNMPEGFVTIPSSGVYLFKMPEVASFTTSGWKEFEMKITGGPNTVVKSSVVKTGGTSTGINAEGAVAINKFFQYPKVNITFAAATLPTNWNYTHSSYNATTQLTGFGGSGSNKTGVPLMPPSSNAKLPSTTRVVKFEIRVKNTTGGAFSFDTSNITDVTNSAGTITHRTFDESQFVASVLDNKDIVSFSNLKAYIGEGASDASGDADDFFTITGTIRCKKFGYQDQIYTIDLSELFNFA